MLKINMGEVKVCKVNCIKKYLRDGDYSIFPEIKTLYSVFGPMERNISKTFKNQILIDLENGKYLWVQGRKILDVKPTEEENIFADESSFSQNKNKTQKTLSKTPER